MDKTTPEVEEDQEEEDFFSADEGEPDDDAVHQAAVPEAEVAQAPDVTSAAAATDADDSECDSDGLEDDDRIEKATAFKEEGNRLFKANEAEAAIVEYKRGLRLCPKSEGTLRAVLYANMAASHVKQDDHEMSLAACDKAVRYNDQYLKAYLRRAASHEKLDNLEKALADYQKVLELDPRSYVALDAVQRLPPLIKEQQEKLKAEMLGKLKDLGNTVLKPFGLSTNNFKFDQDPNTGGYSMSFQK